jgi:hypothetical protein
MRYLANFSRSWGQRLPTVLVQGERLLFLQPLEKRRQTMANPNEINAIRERLKKGGLTSGDIEFIDLTLRERVEIGDLGEIDGRRIIARLPNGMDIVK